MSHSMLVNRNIQTVLQIPRPDEIRQQFPQTPYTQRTVMESRAVIERILDRQDPRLMVIAGPCSIHDLVAAEDYAARLAKLAEAYRDTLFIVMRVYFEKPRTALGWKGFINDPFLDGSFRIDEGLRLARQFLLRVAQWGLPAASEILDPFTPQYLADLVAWAAIGARTSESQTHRDLASGLSMPVGFKNATDGRLDAAVNALRAATGPHHFLGVTGEGRLAVFSTTGNAYPHIVLRGGDQPNFDAAGVRACEQALTAAGLPVRMVIDCSHANSRRNPAMQKVVLHDVMSQIEAGSRSIAGVMLESFIESGCQPIPAEPAQLKYGVSVTDPCMGWEDTKIVLAKLYERHARVIAYRREKVMEDKDFT